MHSRSKNGVDLLVTCWRLDSANRTAAFASFDDGCPGLIYFGPRLPDEEDLQTIARMGLPPVAGGQLDSAVAMTLLPTAHDGWQGNPGIKLAGNAAPRLTYSKAFMQSSRLSWAVSGAADIQVDSFLCPQTGLLQIRLTPADDKTNWLAAAVPVPASLTHIIDHGGRWCGEFQRQKTPMRVGRHVRESHEGRTGHPHFPGAIFASDNCAENSGECLAVAMAWSGGHRMVAERCPDGRQQVQFGFADGMSAAPRDIWIGYSETGFNGVSQPMQHHIRTSQPKIAARPVHYNCWEAVYFRHSMDELKEIATKAAGLGAERFVLDDGWFKGRNDDTTSLGDWVVDAEKYPDGLTPLIDHVQACGMEFGIWFEPEMVNVDSDLYRAHPDWVLGPVDQPSGRGQFVLDLSNPAVTDYLFEAITAILDLHSVTYIKWDHNRILTGGTPSQTMALYALLDKLNKAYPWLQIESCASGGGRLDYGILQHTTRVWLSDSNDALERLRMQHEASRWLPPEVQGSHVGPRQCHTSGRILPMGFRAWVAAQRHMGFEMDPRELTDDEAATLSAVTHWYKQNRAFLFSANHFRLDHPDSEIVAEVFVSPDQRRFVLFAGRLGTSGQIAEYPLRLAGLNADLAYQVEPVDISAAPSVLNQNSGHPQPAPTLTVSGRALISGGLRIPNLFPASMLVYAGHSTEH